MRFFICWEEYRIPKCKYRVIEEIVLLRRMYRHACCPDSGGKDLKRMTRVLPLLISMGVSVLPGVTANGCPTCNPSPNPPNQPPNSIVISIGMSEVPTCIDWDNQPPGHCMMTPVQRGKFVSRRDGSFIGFTSIQYCMLAKPMNPSPPCGDANHCPWFGRPNHPTCLTYWTAPASTPSFTPRKKPNVLTQGTVAADCGCATASEPTKTTAAGGTR